ncbi:MAG: protein phosphatase 2C domain-containing protein [Patescibacteria group bacterium]|nr:protein phosphatase 2C domain-containing protein [Patescibacteria group bacterium]
MTDFGEGYKPPEALPQKPPIETFSTILANPDHPSYSADRAVAAEMAGGKSGIIAAIDGVGSGGEQSAKAAEIVQRNLRSLETGFASAPTINQAVMTLKNAIFAATGEIKALQRQIGDDQVDTTVSTGVVCASPDGAKRFLVVANVGDSRVYRYAPSTGIVEQITRDHSIVEALVASGQITREEAFEHPQRNQIYRCVGSLKAPKDIDFTVTPISDGEIYLAVSDGVSDNLTPTGLPLAIKDEYQKGFDAGTKKVDLKKFSKGIAQRAQNVMTTQSSHAKKDDSCVAVLKAPRL